jgi:hypothetical protein
MVNFIRHFTQRLRLWLIAAAAVLLVTSVLEAGHAHGVFSDVDEHCAICQHSVALDKTLVTSTPFIAPLLLAVFAFTFFTRIAPNLNHRFAQIRAPPVKTLSL